MRVAWIAGGLLIGVGVWLAAVWGGPAEAACPRLEEPVYIGSKACQKCHFREYGLWQKTKMALALNALKPGEAADAKKKANLDPAKDYTKEPKCVVCHVTGYGKPGGYPAIVEGKEWTEEEKARAALREGVGCEVCHGPGDQSSAYKKDHKDYRWADVAKLGLVHPDEKVCATCHNPQSPSYKEFKFAEKIGKDTHQVFKLKADHGCDHPHADGK
jgi:formate-dependent nitrite reductase cytochrome c552 subunit